jgi:Kelch motif/Galactose oxidase, central domain/Fibronectin type III domain
MASIKSVISGGWTRRLRVCAVLGAALIATILLAASASAGTPNTWTPAAPPQTGSAFGATVSLHNGDVLLVGGQDGSGNTTNSSEVYDPRTDTWASAGLMSTPRFLPVAVTLQSGKVLVAGGTTDNTGSTALDTGEVYDPSTNTWTPVANTMSSPRGDYPAIALLPNGDVLIAGGADAGGDAVATADIYNPTSNTFAPASSMSTGRILTAATPLSNGKVLVAGGQDINGAPVDTAEIYDPGTDSWISAANPMSVGRTYPGLAHLPNGEVLVAGGVNSGSSLNSPSTTTATTNIYDPSSNSFTPGPAMMVSRIFFGITPLADGRVLVAGGVTLGGGGGAITGDTEIYDPRTNSWSEAAPLPPIAAFTLSLLPNGQALQASGATGGPNGSSSTQAELYTPTYPPGAPVAVSATPGNRSAYVTFAPPVNDGGLRVTHYTITASSGQRVSTPDGRTFATLTRLTNGRKLTFTVTATNSLGTGPASAPSNAVTPMAPDQAPRLRIFGLARRLRLTSFIHGVRFSVKPNKTASLQISLLASANVATIARAGSLTLASKHMGQSAKLRRVLLAPPRNLVGHPRLAKVELVIVAIDKAGSRSTTSRWITVTGPRSSAPRNPAQVSIPTKSATITPRGDVPIRLKCRLRRADCSGTLTLWPVEADSGPVDALVAACARGCRPLGNAHFHIHAGHTGLVQVQLSSYGRRLLAQQKTLRATATATTSSSTTVTTITIKAGGGVNAPILARRRSSLGLAAIASW